MHFGVKNQFSGILKFPRIFWSGLVGAIGFLEALGMDYLLILSRNDFKGPFKESTTFSVKQRETHILLSIYNVMLLLHLGEYPYEYEKLIRAKITENDIIGQENK